MTLSSSLYNCFMKSTNQNVTGPRSFCLQNCSISYPVLYWNCPSNFPKVIFFFHFKKQPSIFPFHSENALEFILVVFYFTIERKLAVLLFFQLHNFLLLCKFLVCLHFLEYPRGGSFPWTLIEIQRAWAAIKGKFAAYPWEFHWHFLIKKEKQASSFI